MLFRSNGEQENLFDCDGEFLAFLVDQGKEEPLLYVEERSIIYGMIKREGNTYILEPCGLDRNEAENAKYLVRRHHLNPRRPYCVHTVSIDVF